MNSPFVQLTLYTLPSPSSLVAIKLSDNYHRPGGVHVSLFYLIVATKSSNAGNLVRPKRNCKVCPLSENMNSQLYDRYVCMCVCVCVCVKTVYIRFGII
jgi:hypothetical protein